MGMNPANGSGVTTTTNNQASGLVGGGALTFNRISFVSLSGNWGELRMGRDYTPTFNSHVYYDPAALSGVMTSQTAIGSLTIFAPNAPGVALAGARASNSVSYFSPNMSGFNAQVMYAMGNNPSNVPTPDDGKYTGARLQYAAGPLDLSVAAARMKLAAVGDVRETVIAGTYDFNPLKVWGIYLRDTSGTSINVKAEMLGVTYPVGVTLLKATFSRSSATSVTGAPAGTTNKFALGAVYNLSKRTSIYLSGATVRNKDGASAMPFFGVAVNGPNGTSRAFDLGVRHIF
jgi:predicted porin